MAIRANAAPPRRQGGWQNKVLARVVLEALGYNPSKHIKDIKAPIFFRIASQDHLCPVSNSRLAGLGRVYMCVPSKTRLAPHNRFSTPTHAPNAHTLG
jgi:hypothetical protein